MKKLLILAMVCCLALGSAGTAAAIDVNVGGEWEFGFGYYSNNTLHKN